MGYWELARRRTRIFLFFEITNSLKVGLLQRRVSLVKKYFYTKDKAASLEFSRLSTSSSSRRSFFSISSFTPSTVIPRVPSFYSPSPYPHPPHIAHHYTATPSSISTITIPSSLSVPSFDRSNSFMPSSPASISPRICPSRSPPCLSTCLPPFFNSS